MEIATKITTSGRNHHMYTTCAFLSEESLTGNVVFANEAIVDAVFQPSKVDDRTVREILAEINVDKSLKTALNAVVSNKPAETKKYPFMVRRGMSAYRLRR